MNSCTREQIRQSTIGDGRSKSFIFGCECTAQIDCLTHIVLFVDKRFGHVKSDDPRYASLLAFVIDFEYGVNFGVKCVGGATAQLEGA
uniref:Uncharacterized protein n=1 Tax=Romanomermis culicivorax TaxID=13658 RepID=A0A915IIH1_ROMCU